jgi:hypothetical protein
MDENPYQSPRPIASDDSARPASRPRLTATDCWLLSLTSAVFLWLGDGMITLAQGPGVEVLRFIIVGAMSALVIVLAVMAIRRHRKPSSQTAFLLSPLSTPQDQREYSP